MIMVYLDNAATTKVEKRVIDKMVVMLEENFFNPSAMYGSALNVRKQIEMARETVANVMKISESSKLFFTSGGTEANNLAIYGTVSSKGNGKILCSACEHASVFNSMKNLKEKGFDVEYIMCNKNGNVSEEDFLEKISNGKVQFVSIMHVNNETGAINDIARLAKILKSKHPEAFFHSDGVQGFIKQRVSLENVDLYSASAHKLGGAKGVGVLYSKNPQKLKSVNFGGGHEKGKRHGTENVAGIIGFAKAVEIWNEERENIIEKFLSFQKYIIEKIGEISDVTINSEGVYSPHILSISVGKVQGETLLHILEDNGFIVGSGSACSAKEPLSRALKEMGLVSGGTIRISFSKDNNMEEIVSFMETLKNQIEILRNKTK